MSLCMQALDLRKYGWPLQEIDNSGDPAAPDGFGCGEGHLATPISKLTTVDLNGTGAFDVLMRAVKGHLQEEYDEGRIVGKEYATVYIGAITAVLQTASQQLVNEQMAHKTAAELGLIRQKTVTELANTCDSIPVGLGFNYVPTGLSGSTGPCISPINCP